jgi:hypothetical protein
MVSIHERPIANVAQTAPTEPRQGILATLQANAGPAVLGLGLVVGIPVGGYVLMQHIAAARAAAMAEAQAIYRHMNLPQENAQFVKELAHGQFNITMPDGRSFKLVINRKDADNRAVEILRRNKVFVPAEATDFRIDDAKHELNYNVGDAQRTSSLPAKFNIDATTWANQLGQGFGRVTVRVGSGFIKGALQQMHDGEKVQ